MSAEPLHFGPASRPLFGWLHRAPGARLGVVIVAPFGYEAVCAHRSLRAFAEASAASGVTALRFDRDGTGDAAGDDLDPDRVGAWQASIHAACDLLRAETDVEHVVLLGVRLGALLAASAAIARDDVVGLCAVAPVISGRAYVRELKILQRALGLADPPSDVRDRARTAIASDVEEAVGFALTAETRAALGKLDLTKLPRSPAPSVLVLDRADLPTAETWAAQIGADRRAMNGYVEMVLDPHKARVPVEMVRAFTAWLAEVPASRDHAHARERERELVPERARRADPAPVAAGVVESPVVIDELLFGILAEPAKGEPRSGRAVLLLNAGAVSHIGPNRLYVALARRWAALGHVVLRMDNSGIADSQTRSGESDDVVYSKRALEDLDAALRFLRGRGVRDIRAVGLCSGAYHAFKAAVQGQPLEGVVAINPLTFFWHDGDDLDFPAYQVEQHAQRYSHAVFDAKKWEKVLRGQVDLLRATDTLRRFAASRVTSVARRVSRRIGLPWREDLGAELEAVRKRGVALRFVFASADPGLPLLRAQGGGPARRVGIDLIDGPDHTFTPLWSHAELIRVLGAALDR